MFLGSRWTNPKWNCKQGVDGGGIAGFPQISAYDPWR